MKSLKKILLTLIIFLSATCCFGAEVLTVNLGQDYLITTEQKVDVFEVSNPEILSLSPFFTIFNEKNVLLLHPIKLGKTKFSIVLDTGSTTFEINVVPKSDKTPTHLKLGAFDVMLLDSPPVLEEFEIDIPPQSKEEQTK